MEKHLPLAIAVMTILAGAATSQELHDQPILREQILSFDLAAANATAWPHAVPVPLPPVARENHVEATGEAATAGLPAELAIEEVPAPSRLWERSVELGLNGTEGNSQTFNFRFGAKATRKTERNILSTDLDYRRDSADARLTANRAFLESRYEHLLGASPWSWFLHGTLEYNEFLAFDLRVAMDSGLGYRFLRNDTTTLLARLGAGTSREIGGPDDRFVPEVIVGSELEHKISQRQKFCFSAEYRPDVTDFADYRVVSKAGWEILLDEAMNLSMKFTVSDRYDSTPHGLEPNDLDYAVLLLWSF